MNCSPAETDGSNASVSNASNLSRGTGASRIFFAMRTYVKRVPSKQNEERIRLLMWFFLKSQNNGNIYCLTLLAIQGWTESGLRSGFPYHLLVAQHKHLDEEER